MVAVVGELSLAVQQGQRGPMQTASEPEDDSDQQRQAAKPSRRDLLKEHESGQDRWPDEITDRAAVMGQDRHLGPFVIAFRREMQAFEARIMGDAFSGFSIDELDRDGDELLARLDLHSGRARQNGPRACDRRPIADHDRANRRQLTKRFGAGLCRLLDENRAHLSGKRGHFSAVVAAKPRRHGIRAVAECKHQAIGIVEDIGPVMPEILAGPPADIVEQPFMVPLLGIKEGVIPFGNAFLFPGKRRDLLLQSLPDKVGLPAQREIIDLYGGEPRKSAQQHSRRTGECHQDECNVGC